MRFLSFSFIVVLMYNWHALNYNIYSVQFDEFHVRKHLWNLHHHQDKANVSRPQRFLVLLWNPFPSAPASLLTQPVTGLMSLSVGWLTMSRIRKWNNMVYIYIYLACLLSLGMIILRFVHVVAHIYSSFFFIVNISFHGYTKTCLFIHLLTVVGPR